MTVNELAALVEKMRAAQRRYFRHKDNLSDCKALERDVDAAIERIAAGPDLFDVGRQATVEEVPEP